MQNRSRLLYERSRPSVFKLQLWGWPPFNGLDKAVVFGPWHGVLILNVKRNLFPIRGVSVPPTTGRRRERNGCTPMRLTGPWGS